MSRQGKEPPAPTPMDEAMSIKNLASSPWVIARIKELGFEGKKVNHWTPPQYSLPFRPRLSLPSSN